MEENKTYINVFSAVYYLYNEKWRITCLINNGIIKKYTRQFDMVVMGKLDRKR